jgi:hypothetical protein
MAGILPAPTTTRGVDAIVYQYTVFHYSTYHYQPEIVLAAFIPTNLYVAVALPVQAFSERFTN